MDKMILNSRPRWFLWGYPHKTTKSLFLISDIADYVGWVGAKTVKELQRPWKQRLINSILNSKSFPTHILFLQSSICIRIQFNQNCPSVIVQAPLTDSTWACKWIKNNARNRFTISTFAGLFPSYSSVILHNTLPWWTTFRATSLFGRTSFNAGFYQL